MIFRLVTNSGVWTWLMVEGEDTGAGRWLNEHSHNVDVYSEKFC